VFSLTCTTCIYDHEKHKKRLLLSIYLRLRIEMICYSFTDGFEDDIQMHTDANLGEAQLNW
jgi:hypothetical protein